ncbi:hypothetical protein Vadar_001350 [Vaccinium darrowii]|uniref:Uncharacterized protein n=1 Tax=Vaccinium darrowii TaxID=229202 RepID=A0ACB7ZHH2_9ERIC|nr:hypothetical protein Vadar_001350 [Vaccinium darrowii]
MRQKADPILVRVEDEGTVVVFLDALEVLVVIVVVDFKEGIVVEVVVEAFLGGNEDIDDGNDLFGAVKQRVDFYHPSIFNII